MNALNAVARWWMRLLFLCTLLVPCLFLSIQTTHAQSLQLPSQPTAGYDELTRGPIHEAFAEQVSLEPQPGIIVPKEPPSPINELPPENRPTDANAQWIGGYWAFMENDGDEDGSFIWVSGVWRVPPPRHQWVPGYWSKADAGFQWIGGFWTSTERDEVTYLPEPPETLEEGPTSAAPGEQHYWIPGCWYYRNTTYVWRPGYWAELQPNYVWIPHYYRWSPGGYVLCGGYYDFALAKRGCLFAPVRFHSPLYSTSWYYRPTVMLDTGPLHFHLFVRPNHCHYYFGDYYHTRYTNRGFYPWHDYCTRRHSYDPLFTFNVTRYRKSGIDFHDRVKRWHHWYHDHDDYRPRHTFAEQRRFEDRHRDRDDFKTAFIASSFHDVVHRHRHQFTRSRDDDHKHGNFGDELSERYRQLRSQRESAERHSRGPRGNDADRSHDGHRHADRDSHVAKSLDLRRFQREKETHKPNSPTSAIRGGDIASVRRNVGGESRWKPQVSVSPGNNSKESTAERTGTNSPRATSRVRERIANTPGENKGQTDVPRSTGFQRSEVRSTSPFGTSRHGEQVEKKSSEHRTSPATNQIRKTSPQSTSSSQMEALRQRIQSQANAARALTNRSATERFREAQRSAVNNNSRNQSRNSTVKNTQEKDSYRSHASSQPQAKQRTSSSNFVPKHPSSASRAPHKSTFRSNADSTQSSRGASSSRSRVGSGGFQSSRGSNNFRGRSSSRGRGGRDD